MPFAKQPRIDLTSRDWRSIVTDFTKPGGYLEQRFGEEYTDIRDTELGAALIELVASVGDVFNYAADQEINEHFLVTMREVQSALSKAHDMAYQPKNATAARHAVTFTILNYPPQYVVPRGTVLTTDGSSGEIVRFELEADAVKAIDATTFDGTVAGGVTVIDPEYVSSGQISTRFTLQKPDVIWNSQIITVDGLVWLRTDDFSSSTPSDTHYRLLFEEEVPGTRHTIVEFGDGVNGAVPPNGSRILPTYRIGGGSKTNVPIGSINRFDRPLNDPFGNALYAVVENTQVLSVATDAETIDDLRVNIPATLRTNNRIISNSDHEDAAKKAGAIRAKALTNNEWPAIDENTVVVYVAVSTERATTLSEATAIKNSILAAKSGRDTRRLVVVPSPNRVYTPHLHVYLQKSAIVSEVEPLVLERLEQFYGPSSVTGLPPHYVVDIGRPLRRSNLMDQIDELKGVSYSELDVEEDFVPGMNELPLVDISQWTISYAYDVTDNA